MRIAVAVIGAILVIILAGGIIAPGGVPLFARVDSWFDTTILMDTHYALFSFAHKTEQTATETVGGAKAGVDDLAGKAEFGKKEKYKTLDKSSGY